MNRPSRCARAVRTLATLLVVAAPARGADGDFLGRGIDAFDLGGADLDSGTAVVVQPDGKVIVAGTAVTGAASHTLALARFLPDGGLDPTFGVAGESVNPFNEPNNLAAVALHLLPDGRILVACNFDFGTADQDFYVGRLLESGAPDPSFGGGGFGARLVPFDLGGDLTDTLSAMTLDRNGRILLAGSVDISATDIDFGVVRLTSEGLLDNDFSQDGKTTLAIATLDFGLAIAYHTTGIVVGGASWNTDLGGHFDLALARLQGNGDIDGNFGALGSVTVPWALGGTNNDFAWALGIWPDGEIVVAADIAIGTSQWMYLLSNFSASGTLLDSVLGTFCGSLSSPPCSGTAQDSPRALLLQGDGKLLVAGFGPGPAGDADFGLARWTRDLFPDPGFGGGDGTTTYDFDAYGGLTDTGNAMAFDRDGRIVVAGSTEWNGLDTDFAWARFDSSYIFADSFDWPGGTARWSATVP